MKAAGLARWAAAGIAAMAALDPAIEREQIVRADVAVVAGPGAEADAARLADGLAPDFDVIHGADPSASVTLLAGVTVPPGASRAGGTVIVARPSSPARVRIAGVMAPDRVSVHSRARMDVQIDVAAGAAPATIALEDRGATLDRQQIETPGAQSARLEFLPSRAGPALLRVTARDADDALLAAVDVAVLVHDTPWRVLFHDARPSWMSTFVRRALEGDPRFDVVTRVAASPGMVVRIGPAPGTLAGWNAFDDFDVVVVGAPDALGAADVTSLDRFARERGGTVVLPLDRLTTGAHDRLLRVDQWDAVASPGTILVQPSGGLAPFQAAELGWPAALPAAAEVLATAATPEHASAPVAWRLPAVAGAVVVSGALDAWRFRADDAGFAGFWTTTIAEAAARALPPLSIEPGAVVAAPGERTTLTALLRDVAIGGATGAPPISLRAVLEAGDRRTDLSVWPSGPAGTVEIPVVAPAEPGAYTITLSSGVHSASAALVVSNEPGRANPDESALTDAWARSRGGRTTGSSTAEVRDAIRAAANPPVARAEWHPMRSPWWIAPFALLLGAEWWWRRQRGLP